MDSKDEPGEEGDGDFYEEIEDVYEDEQEELKESQ